MAEVTETKRCTGCGYNMPLNFFRSKGGKNKHLLNSRCNKCRYQEHRDWCALNKDRVLAYRARDSWDLSKRCARRGITPEELIQACERQGGVCPICTQDIDLQNSAIDHNHRTNTFRGVLCRQCNRALGMFKDSPTILQRAVDYLNTNGNYGEDPDEEAPAILASMGKPEVAHL